MNDTPITVTLDKAEQNILVFALGLYFGWADKEGKAAPETLQRVMGLANKLGCDYGGPNCEKSVEGLAAAYAPAKERGS